MFSRGDSPCTVEKTPNKKQVDPQTCGLSALRFNTFTLTLFMLHNVFCSSAQTLNLCSLLWNYDISHGIDAENRGETCWAKMRFWYQIVTLCDFLPALKIDLGMSCMCKDMKAENSGNASVRPPMHFLKGLSLLGSVGGSKLSQVTSCTAHQPSQCKPRAFFLWVSITPSREFHLFSYHNTAA